MRHMIILFRLVGKNAILEKPQGVGAMHGVGEPTL